MESHDWKRIRVCACVSVFLYVDFDSIAHYSGGWNHVSFERRIRRERVRAAYEFSTPIEITLF